MPSLDRTTPVVPSTRPPLPNAGSSRNPLAQSTPPINTPSFDFEQALGRSIGWVTREELLSLRTRRVAIAGLGGVGGSHLLTLTRMGVGRFHLADFDSFELANFNRQAGATLSTIDLPKVDVLARMALDINPTLDIQRFPDGVNERNVDRFLDGVDLYVDSLDFFALTARRLVFDRCAKKGIPALTAAPLGMGCALLCFMPGQMTFEQYFRMEGRDEVEQLLRFLVGLAPANLHRPCLVDPSAVDLAGRKGPSTPMGCELCAGIAGTTALKILLQRGDVVAAPHGLQFDAYRNRLVRTWRPGGNRNPIQRLTLAVARRMYAGKLPQASDAPSPSGIVPSKPDPIRDILDTARWAPSGDNAQPWRFEIVSDRHVVVHGFDTRDHCIYDLCGRASQLALGALLETIRIAASAHGLAVQTQRRPDTPETEPTFDVVFTRDQSVRPDPLLPFVTTRCTQRRAMKTRKLPATARAALERAAGDGFEIIWRQGFWKRLSTAALLFSSAKIRLTIREAYRTHRDAIQWGARFSEDRLPDKAIGLDPVTTLLMRGVMKSWFFVWVMNHFLAGTFIPRLELDLIPGLRCGAHAVLLARRRPTTLDDHVAAGGAVQRFWLTAASLGLQLQPQMTPLIFRNYVRSGLWFTRSKRAMSRADRLAIRLETMLGFDGADRAVFIARLGFGPAPRSRSLRRPLEQLLQHQDQT